jgi:hypothetical protein
MMLCDISVVFNSFADAFGLMNRKRSSESRQVLVSFQSTEFRASGGRQAEAVKRTYISQNFNDRRARAAHSAWQSLAR